MLNHHILGLRTIGFLIALVALGAIIPQNPASAEPMDSGITSSSPLEAITALDGLDQTRPSALTVCASGCDHERIQDALDNAEAGTTIFVGNGTYQETLVISGSVSLRGVSPEATVIDGNGGGPVVTVQYNSAATISQFTIRGGVSAYGAGILNFGAAVLLDSIVEDNHTDDPQRGYGGGIFNWGGSFIMRDTVVRQNSAELGGGVLNSYGTMDVEACRIEENEAVQYGAGIFNGAGARLNVDTLALVDNEITSFEGNGGGLYSAGFAFIRRSEFVGNKVQNLGGAIYQYVDTTVVSNSTISSNEASFGGAGIYVATGSVLSTNVTFANNRGGSAAIWSNLPPDSEELLMLRNTLLADNPGGSCFGQITSGGHNLDTGNSCNFSETGDQINVDPRIEPLADNGGPLRTHGLLSDSPAIDAGDPEGCTAPDNTLMISDQRGEPRPVDGDGDGSKVCDIGAFEFSDSRFTPPPTATPGSLPPGQHRVCPTGCDFATLAEAVAAASAGEQINIDPGEYSGNVQIDKDLRIYGAGEQHTHLDGEHQGAVLSVDEGIMLELKGVNVRNGSDSAIRNAGDLTLRDSMVSQSSGSDAGGIYHSGDELLVENSRIRGNLSLGSGGGIHALSGNAEIRESNIRNNGSAVDGGGVFATGGIPMTIQDSSILSNSARNGGGIAVDQARFSAEGGELVGNRARFGGGAFFRNVSEETERPTLEGTELRENSGQFGGGIYTMRDIDIQSVAFNSNNALPDPARPEAGGGLGGALMVRGVRVALEDATLSGNQALAGGALYGFLGAEVQSEGGEWLQNSARFGGAVFLSEAGLTGDATDMIGNVATLDGGGAYVENTSKLILQGGELSDNSSTRNGGFGFIKSDAEPAEVSGVRMERNAADGGGGAFHVEGSLQLRQAALVSNEGLGDLSSGGAVQVIAGGLAEVTESEVTLSDAYFGGAFAISGTLRASNLTLGLNSAGAGGAVFTDVEGDFECSNCTIAGNLVNPVDGDTARSSAIHSLGNVTLSNTIVGFNEGADSCEEPLDSSGYNLDADGSCGLAGIGDVSGLDPLLKEFDDLGTMGYFGLESGSPAIDAGDPEGCRDGAGELISVDQLGNTRPVDGDGDGEARCDMGSVEIRAGGGPVDGGIFLPYGFAP